jgi:hypothetical protein
LQLYDNNPHNDEIKNIVWLHSSKFINTDPTV